MGHHPEGPILIIGAGPTGLGAAHELCRQGFEDWRLYEREPVVGGLARSFRDERGFTWDLGGHVVFSRYDTFTRLLDGLLEPADWLYHERESWIRVLDRWVPYPFQNNIHHLPRDACARCLEGLIRAARQRSQAPFAHFEDFISRTFGEGIAAIFLRPYNAKAWAYPPATLDSDWIADRVPVPDAARVARNVLLGTDDVSWGPNSRFRFPRTGGTGAIWQAVADRLPASRLALNCEAVEVEPEGKRIRFSDGREERYGTLIATIPLDRLAALARQPAWMEAAAGLRHSSLHVIGVGLAGRPSPEIETMCWMYFPEEAVPFYRVTHFSRYSPNNVDDINRHWSLLAEVSESPRRPVDRSTLVEATVAGLAAAGLIEGPDQVVHTWTRRIEYAYPTPSVGRDAILGPLLGHLRECDIMSRGRFGAWRYEAGNMDHAFMQGVEVVRSLLHGAPERTLRDPPESPSTDSADRAD